ncbi:MAG: hypothetical protein AAF203_02005 [Pseudomonadota bacterium]
MFRKFYLLSLLSALFLFGCGDELEAIKASQEEEQVKARQAEWSQYLEENPSYTMSYELIGIDDTDAKVVTFEDGEITQFSDQNHRLTMDEVYAQLIVALNDPDCKVKYRIDRDLPIVDYFEAECNEVVSGIDVVEFSGLTESLSDSDSTDVVDDEE